jgi:hypothetical protein
MNESDKLKFLFQELSKNPKNGGFAIMGTVVSGSVDKTANTCDVDPLDDSATIMGVDLNADKGEGVLLYPKEGSLVYVVMTTGATGFVAMFSEVETLSIKAGGKELKQILLDFITSVKTAERNTPSGPSTGLVVPTQFNLVENDINTMFE